MQLFGTKVWLVGKHRLTTSSTWHHFISLIIHGTVFIHLSSVGSEIHNPSFTSLMQVLTFGCDSLVRSRKVEHSWLCEVRLRLLQWLCLIYTVHLFWRAYLMMKCSSVEALRCQYTGGFFSVAAPLWRRWLSNINLLINQILFCTFHPLGYMRW